MHFHRTCCKYVGPPCKFDCGCLLGQGACHQSNEKALLKYATSGGTYSNAYITLSKGCSCKLSEDSLIKAWAWTPIAFLITLNLIGRTFWKLKKMGGGEFRPLYNFKTNNYYVNKMTSNVLMTSSIFCWCHKICHFSAKILVKTWCYTNCISSGSFAILIGICITRYVRMIFHTSYGFWNYLKKKTETIYWINLIKSLEIIHLV